MQIIGLLYFVTTSQEHVWVWKKKKEDYRNCPYLSKGLVFQTDRTDSLLHIYRIDPPPLILLIL